MCQQLVQKMHWEKDKRREGDFWLLLAAHLKWPHLFSAFQAYLVIVLRILLLWDLPA